MPVPAILVVGSVNLDIVARVDHVPAPGENVRGTDLATVPGGKGANQAVACARLGARTMLLGRVGDDAFGRRLTGDLDSAGVVTDEVAAVEGCASGVALIMVDARGQNSIVVTAGANARLGPDDLHAARPLFDTADAVLLQLEIPPEAVAWAVHLGREAGCRIIVDAGPPRGSVEEAVFAADVLTPNEAEAAALLDREPGGAADIETLAADLLDRGPGAVVVKCAERGAYLAAPDQSARVPAFSVEPVDTTAAGDAFTAALAVETVRGTGLREAVRIANAAGALACTVMGAQPSMPTADQLALFLREHPAPCDS